MVAQAGEPKGAFGAGPSAGQEVEARSSVRAAERKELPTREPPGCSSSGVADAFQRRPCADAAELHHRVRK